MAGELEMNDWYTGMLWTSSTPHSGVMHNFSSEQDLANTALSVWYIKVLKITPKNKC